LETAAVDPETRREERAAKRARVAAQARFGDSARVDDGKGVERVDVVIEDAFAVPSTTTSQGGALDGGDGGEEEDNGQDARRRGGGGRKSALDASLVGDGQDEEEWDGDSAEGTRWRPSIKLTFHGTHVFAGIRQLVEHGIIDGERMPGWLTGEEGVTVGAVRNGRIRGHKGSGL